MIKYIIIVAACVVACGLGLAVALWSIYRTHRMLGARNSGLTRRVDAAMQLGTRAVTHRPPPPPPAALNIAGRIEVLRPKAGDMLVFQADRPLTQDQREHIRAQACQFVPDGVKLVVLDANMSVKHVVAPPASSTQEEAHVS
jgi:hypothetical protein